LSQQKKKEKIVDQLHGSERVEKREDSRVQSLTKSAGKKKQALYIYLHATTERDSLQYSKK
jgi:hypothetical protein